MQENNYAEAKAPGQEKFSDKLDRLHRALEDQKTKYENAKTAFQVSEETLLKELEALNQIQSEFRNLLIPLVKQSGIGASMKRPYKNNRSEDLDF